jgi:UDP-N-acetylmuramoyl-L-alanyl-D-glutamate--2,6-diaminopimelate ligase
MRLSELGVSLTGGQDPEITGLSEDSRRVSRGMLFVAVPGTSLDGHAYIAEAVQRGAAAVVAERGDQVPADVPLVLVPSAREALAKLAARFHGQPARGLKLIGFTGTFGKTSTSDILRALLASAGSRPGVLGSLGARYANFHDAGNGLTTPAPVELHRALYGLRQAGADTVIMEVTSHALRMGRVSGLTFSGGMLAAIMPGEHTDFHHSFDDYVAAKRLFLDYLQPEAVLAFDADNTPARTLAADATVRARAGFSLNGASADLTIRDAVLDATGAHFTVAGERLHSPLLGQGHLRNVALALAYAFHAGVSPAKAREVLPTLSPLKRRMERSVVSGRTILDDTAAHPDSLRATFQVAEMLSRALRAVHAASRVVVTYAIRGNRGADINRRNALALAELAALHRTDRLIVTAAADTAGSADRAAGTEVDATTDALKERGCAFVWRDTLQDAMHLAMNETVAGDLIVLAGAQGMDRGREMLSR